MKRWTILFPLLLALGSCASSHRNIFPDLSRFPISYDASSGLNLCRNGDLYHQQKLEKYNEVFRKMDVNSFANRVEFGEASFVYLYSETCPSCNKVMQDVVTFVKESGLDGHYIDFTDQSSGIATTRALAEILPKEANFFDSTGSIITPSAFVVRRGKDPLALQVVEFDTSLNDLESYFANILHFTGIFRFTQKSICETFVNENDVLLYSGSDISYYYKSIYPKAIQSQRLTVIADGASPYEGQDTDLYLIRKGLIASAVNTKKAPEEALSLIRDYYN